LGDCGERTSLVKGRRGLSKKSSGLSWRREGRVENQNGEQKIRHKNSPSTIKILILGKDPALEPKREKRKKRGRRARRPVQQ